MAFKTISGTVELTTGAYTPDETSPVYQLENGATLLSLDLENSGSPYTLGAGESAYVKMYFTANNTETAYVLMDEATGNISLELPTILTAVAGQAVAFVKITGADDALLFSCKIPIPILRTSGTAVTSYEEPAAGTVEELEAAIAGKIDKYSELPTAAVEYLGITAQFTGATDVYTNGYFYICQSDGGGGYEWAEKKIGDYATAAQGALADTAVQPAEISALKNYEYCGRDLSTIFADAAALHAAVAAGNFANIHVGDYWPITLTGSYRDVSSYTCPSGVNYFSDSGLTTGAGTTAQAYEAIYVNATYCAISIGGTTYYVATGDCLAYYIRSFSSAVFKLEVSAINPYKNYGDSTPSNHIVLCSRDLMPHLLKMRRENSTWHDAAATVPWLGSALYATLNDVTNGILPLVAATDIGAYLYAGPNSKGMRYLAETKAAGVSTATGWAWADRGKLFLPSEREVWGGHVWDEQQYDAGLSTQWPIFRDSTRHIAKGLGNGGSRNGWWCLSSYGGSSTYFTYVNSSAYPNITNTAYPWLSAPLCFLVS